MSTDASGDLQVMPLPCDSCALKEWDTHPKGGKPWCAEQITFPIMQERGGHCASETCTEAFNHAVLRFISRHS